jgi:hypothetical protein
MADDKQCGVKGAEPLCELAGQAEAAAQHALAPFKRAPPPHR